MSIIKNSFAEAYKDTLYEVYHNPDYITNPRGMKIKEKINFQFTITNPLLALYENTRRSSQNKYIAAELYWYFSGRNDLDFISKYAQFWNTIANDNGTLNSAYGNLIFTEKNEFGYSQWEWSYNKLIEDKDTRQAILHFNKPHHQYDNVKDFVCTMYGIFNIRDNKLNFSIYMRSNDLILGCATDVAFFCLLQIQMLNLLKNLYPDLELGSYTHHANSMHIYEKNFNLVVEMLENEFFSKELPILDINLVDIKGNPNEDFLNLNDKYKFLGWIKKYIK